VKIKRLRFVCSIAQGRDIPRRGALDRVVGEIAVNFVGGRKKKKRIVAAIPRSFQNVERATDIHIKIEPRIYNRSSYRYLGSEVVNLCRVTHRPVHERGVAYVSYRDLQAPGFARGLLKKFEIVPGTLSHKAIEDMHLCFRSLQQPMCPVRADEAGSPENQD
jgi:hypothetical protein